MSQTYKKPNAREENLYAKPFRAFRSGEVRRAQEWVKCSLHTYIHTTVCMYVHTAKPCKTKKTGPEVTVCAYRRDGGGEAEVIGWPSS